MAWSDLDLFGAEPLPLGVSNTILWRGLSKAEQRAQDIIFDLYKTERHFCQNVAIVKQVCLMCSVQCSRMTLLQLYCTNLEREHILTTDQLNRLIPRIFQHLIDFHFQLLRELKEARAREPVVRNYNEILQRQVAFLWYAREDSVYLQFSPAFDRRRNAVAAHVKLVSILSGPEEYSVKKLHEQLLGACPDYAHFTKASFHSHFSFLT